jgi:hypothetical protein
MDLECGSLHVYDWMRVESAWTERKVCQTCYEKIVGNEIWDLFFIVNIIIIFRTPESTIEFLCCGINRFSEQETRAA